MSAPTVSLRNGVVAQVFDREMVLLDVAAGSYFELNASGTAMLQSLLGGSSREQTIDAVCRQFEVDAARVTEDLDALLAALREAGLVEG
jgi:hypothetical protein